MSDIYFTIRLDNFKIELSKNVYLNYEETNLPKHAFNLKTREPVFWQLEQKNYDHKTNTLIVSVVNYKATEEMVDQNRKQKYPVKKLIFEKLDWIRFEPLIYSYNLSELKANIYNYRDKYFDFRSENNLGDEWLKKSAPNLFFQKSELPKQDVEIQIKVKYEDAKFKNGKVEFTAFIKPFKVEIILDILNDNIREEFEYIKPYFIKKLGKTFFVNVIILEKSLDKISVVSDDINKIDANLIDSIKVQSTLDLIHFQKVQPDIMVLDADTLSSEGNPLIPKSAEEIFEIFIQNSKIRNLKQLEYLASDRQSLKEKLLFTIKPIFGFLFRESIYPECFIWELLNSHATYVWKKNINVESNEFNQEVENAIASISGKGRETYKKYYKSLSKPIFSFHIITHSSKKLTVDESFNAWKVRLEEICK